MYFLPCIRTCLQYTVSALIMGNQHLSVSHLEPFLCSPFLSLIPSPPSPDPLFSLQFLFGLILSLGNVSFSLLGTKCIGKQTDWGTQPITWLSWVRRPRPQTLVFVGKLWTVMFSDWESWLWIVYIPPWCYFQSPYSLSSIWGSYSLWKCHTIKFPWFSPWWVNYYCSYMNTFLGKVNT